jgi:hypothetical protein
MRLPAEFGNPATSFLQAQAYLAGNSIGRDLDANERVKIVCVRSENNLCRVENSTSAPTIRASMTSRASKRVRQTELSEGRDRSQERNYCCSVVGGCESAIWLHIVARHQLIGICDEALKLFFVPHEVGALQSAGLSPLCR